MSKLISNAIYIFKYFFEKLMPLIRTFRNYVFLNTYAKVFRLHTIPFPVYFLKVRYSSEAVWLDNSRCFWNGGYFVKLTSNMKRGSFWFSTSSHVWDDTLIEPFIFLEQLLDMQASILDMYPGVKIDVFSITFPSNL